jgi:hypothetical protein
MASMATAALLGASTLLADQASVPKSIADRLPLPSARELVDRHLAAIGGVKAYKAIQSFHAGGQFEIAGVGLGGDFDLYAARPNRMIVRMTIPALGVIEQGFNGKIGWTLNPVAGPEVLGGRELRETTDDAWFDRTLYEDDRVRSMTTVERVSFDSRPAFKVRVVLQSGTETFDFFDVESGMNVGTESERATPQGIIPTTTMLRNYRKFGTLLQPTLVVQRAIGVEQVMTISSVEYDAVPDAMFAVPPVIAALIDK